MMMILIQSLLQIILESLPISSSGHLALVESICGWQPLSQACEYLLHGPTLVVLACYFRKIWIMLLCNCWRFRLVIARMVLWTALADILTAVVYWSAKYVGPSLPLSVGFFATMLLLYSLHFQHATRYQPVTLHKLLIIGIVQGCAGLPALSRLVTTLVTGIWLGLSPQKAFAVSYMVQAPLIGAGFLYGLVQGDATCSNFFLQPLTLFALSIATLIAYLLLWWVDWCIDRHSEWKFSYYMVLPLILSLLY